LAPRQTDACYDGLSRFVVMAIAVALFDCVSAKPQPTESDSRFPSAGCIGALTIPEDTPIRILTSAARSEEFPRVPRDTCQANERCVFANQANTVTCELVSRDLLCHTSSGYKCNTLSQNSEVSAAKKLILVTASMEPFKLAVAMELRENVLGSLEFEYLIEVTDPSTCKKRRIPLGRFKPSDAALSCGGDALLVQGRNNDTLEHSVRVINTRSGVEERLHKVDRRWKKSVALYATGYSIASENWMVEVRPELLPNTCATEPPKCSQALPLHDLSGSTVAVSFTVQEGLESDAGSLALLVLQGLIDLGYTLREKASNLNEIFEEQELQQVHADDATAVRTGRLIGASHLVLGRLGVLDENTQVLSLRLVSVERATVSSVSSVSLENCDGRELQKALVELVGFCAGRPHHGR